MLPPMPPLIRALRPRQWLKNLVVFAGLAFSGKALEERALGMAALAFVLFCAASSAVYLFNDVLDRERDRLHPLKQKRPLASGQVAVGQALFVASLLAVAAVVGAAQTLAWPAIAAYLVLQLAYTLRLKHVVILDVFCIAAGFLLRVLAGVWAIEAPLSPWLVACTVQLALFLALCKRRAELAAVAGGSTAQRPLLEEYEGPAIDLMIGVVASSTVVTYALYTLLPAALLSLDLPDMESRAGQPGMIWTLPFVLYGVLRYLYLVYRQDQGERPERILTGDPPLLAAVACWAGVVGWVVYL